ncbi:chain length determinant protein EpsF [Vogesella urethralis]|uniref:chain length determinant protein EpsF n=1 Tax=Vogesella urethralis TaxID=2592656 RepID=UPI001184AD2C|nr:chain length determinant protein EpsF [Vogesella urethralis]
MNISQFVQIIKARKWVGIAAFGTVVLATAATTVLMQKQYMAEAALAVDVKAVDPVTGSPVQGYLAPSFMATQVDIIQSQSVALKVVDGLGLTAIPALRDSWLAATGGRGDMRFWLADRLLSRLDVQPSRESNVITLAYTSPDPRFSATVTNAFAEAYIRMLGEMRTAAAFQSNQFFQQQLKELQAKLEAAQQQLSSYQQEHGIVASDEKVDIETQRLNELSSQLVGLQSATADARSRVRGGVAAPDVLNNPLIQQLKNQLASQEAKFNELAQKNGPNHPHYQQAQAELEATRSQLQQLMAQYAGGLDSAAGNAASRQGALEGALQQQKARVLELKTQRAKLDVLQRDVDNAQRSYDQALQRFSQTALESRSEQANISMLKSAVEPTAPASPRLLVNMLLAVFVGLLMGVISALLAELFDRRVRASSDIETLLGLPVLAVLAEKDKPAPWWWARRKRMVS